MLWSCRQTDSVIGAPGGSGQRAAQDGPWASGGCSPSAPVMMSPGTSDACAAGLPGSTPVTMAPCIFALPKLDRQFRREVLQMQADPVRPGRFRDRAACWQRTSHRWTAARIQARSSRGFVVGQQGGVDPDHVARAVEQGPPELPGLIEASVWMKSSNGVRMRSRFNALITPVVTEVPRPSGLPMAITGWPTRAASLLSNCNVGSGCRQVHLEQGEVHKVGRGDQLRRHVRLVMEDDPDQRSTLDDVLVGDDDRPRDR